MSTSISKDQLNEFFEISGRDDTRVYCDLYANKHCTVGDEHVSVIVVPNECVDEDWNIVVDELPIICVCYDDIGEQPYNGESIKLSDKVLKCSIG